MTDDPYKNLRAYLDQFPRVPQVARMLKAGVARGTCYPGAKRNRALIGDVRNRGRSFRTYRNSSVT